MLKNLITDEMLKDYYPLLANQIWNTQTSYAKQISLAYDILMNRLHNMNVDPELVNPVLDLFNDTTIKIVPPVQKTITSAITGSTYASNYQRRVVLEVGAMSGSFNLYIDGAKTKDTPTGNEYYAVATSFALTSSYANSTVTQNIDSDYSWIRYRIEPTTGAGTTITTNCYMISPIFDSAIAHKALELIFCDFRKEVDDTWDLRAKEEKSRFDEELSSIKYAYDANQDGIINDTEKATKTINITFTR